MNIAAHLNPVVLVIDPLSDPCAPRAIPYSLDVAFAASGMVMAGMPGLAKLQRSQTFADAETELAAAWAGEVKRTRAPVDNEALDRMSMQRRAAVVAARDKAMIAKAARRARVLAALASGPMSRADLSLVACLAESTTKRFLAEMCNEGMIDMKPVIGSRRNFVYEVTA